MWVRTSRRARARAAVSPASRPLRCRSGLSSLPSEIGGTGGSGGLLPSWGSDLVRRARSRQFHRAGVGRTGVGQVDLGVGPRRNVGEDQPAGAGTGGGLARLTAVEVQVGDVLLAV